MNNDNIKAEIMDDILKLSDRLKEQIHETNIIFSNDDKKIIIEFNI
jgi:hypothetical protein